MTDEERSKKMDFIIEQQAKFAVDIQMLQEAHAQGEKRMSEIEKGFLGLFNLLSDVAKAQQENARAQQENAAQIAILTEAQKRTDERLNAFIFVLEQDISQRQSGRAGKRGTPLKRATTKKGAAKKNNGR